MTCNVEIRGETIHIDGEMTIYAAANLKEDLFAAIAGRQQCRVDLSNISELDMCGLQMLLMAKRICVYRNAHFSVVQASAAVREVAELLCIDDLCAAPAVEA
jgi:anti-sigma B factor antagonist